MKENNITDNSAEKNLQVAIAKLPKEISPERDLWSGIDRAINQNTRVCLLYTSDAADE